MKRAALVGLALSSLLLFACQNGGGEDASSTSSTGSEASTSSEIASSSTSSTIEDSSSTSTSYYDGDISSLLSFKDEFVLEAGNVGYFSLSLVEKGYAFLEEIEEANYTNFSFGDAFSELEIYSIFYLEEEDSLAFVTIGELSGEENYGTLKGKDILTIGGSFEIKIPIVAASLTAEGMFYSTKAQNTISLTIENAAFHSDISQDDILLGGGLSDAEIISITPNENSGYEVLEHGSFKQMYQEIELTFSDVLGPEEYGYITILDEGTTYNGDLETSFDFYRSGAQLLTNILTNDLKDTLVFAFANLTLNTSISISDISVDGALEGTSLDALEIIDYLDYGKAIALDVTYPSTFFEVALSDDYDADLTGSFIFSSNSNAEGEELKVNCSVPTPDIEETYEFDDSSNVVTTTMYISNGNFYEGLKVDDFSYDEGETDLEVSNKTLSLNEAQDTLVISCVMPESFDHGFVDLTITNLIEIDYSFEDKVSYYQYDSVQYFA